MKRLKSLEEVDLGFAKVDLKRAENQGFGEVVYAERKTVPQLIKIVKVLKSKNGAVLITRCSSEQLKAVKKSFSNCHCNDLARVVRIGSYQKTNRQSISIGLLAAGTSDLSVAEEAAEVLHFFGFQVERIYDVGVAGLHRLLSRLELIRSQKGLIVVAGMEGALPSVVGGLVSLPIVAVPTSVGYGSHGEGITALLGMLNSCASGLTVVNIDNGFGAAMAMVRIFGTKNRKK